MKMGTFVKNDLPPKRCNTTLSDDDFLRIARLLVEFAGISIPSSNRALVHSRLSRRVRSMGFNSFREYIDSIEGGRSRGERDMMISALTTNTTRFFRENYHFDFFRENILQNLVEQAMDGKRIRLWSAACSSGEEPYSLAAVVLQGFPRAPDFDFKILATDVDREVLDVARAGVYPKSSIESVPAILQPSLFKVLDNGARFEVREEVKSLLSFRYLNFKEPWPVKGPFQVIFCRNAVIYMEPDMQSMVWSGLASVMDLGATLFIGHSERIGREFDDRLVSVGKTAFERI